MQQLVILYAVSEIHRSQNKRFATVLQCKDLPTSRTYYSFVWFSFFNAIEWIQLPEIAFDEQNFRMQVLVECVTANDVYWFLTNALNVHQNIVRLLITSFFSLLVNPPSRITDGRRDTFILPKRLQPPKTETS